ncbi:hypothetical protein FJV41_01440 [Myxococcus llanfairpwllgwyngyllgogerychwyrndrobwllllantysiliogogogochensis]|uniref:Uncharacterized protein n=1 Tax=Myxococcus llanfairpwllgwyngyllgogerychwyrndrobwllllantysiliogogogochensis TaxID=2590453 RepID=A0A540X961_9BACT|nr:hypothetical protein [Myxococcus llanfairpwllgwyngyllgogerychwyrndrobwllllantysiliogogogochensis]TQF17833.1 hypothetical protein FJV41_01440 [Myxococcus llanfairpwllgwyngyllgogerychwyrndrobwllllantysiliogogogochensis]
MVHLIITSIKTIRTGLYEVTLQNEGVLTTAQSSVKPINNIQIANPSPDISMRRNGRVAAYPRDICAAIVAFDGARIRREELNETQRQESET